MHLLRDEFGNYHEVEMIRVVDLRNQISEDGETKEYAVYNTVSDRFLEAGGFQVFESAFEFAEAAREDGWKELKILRVTSLFPKDAR